LFLWLAGGFINQSSLMYLVDCRFIVIDSLPVRFQPTVMKCPPLKFALVCLFALCHLNWTFAEPWPQLRGPDRSGISREIDVLGDSKQPPTLIWMGEGVGSGFASVSISDGFVYTTGNRDGVQVVSAVDAATGKIAWQQPITSRIPNHDYEGSRSTPTIDGALLFACGSDGSIHCLERASGKLIWSHQYSQWNGKLMSGWGFSESPLVDGDIVLCTPGSDSKVVVALNKQNGQELWSTAIPDPDTDPYDKGLREGAGYSSIMISYAAGVKQYVTLVGRGVIGIRAADGKLLWRYTRIANTVANIPTVLVKDDFVFCSTAYDTGSALLKLSATSDGVEAQEQYFLGANQLQNKHGGMVLIDGYVYCGHGNGSGLPICVEMSTGKSAWGPVRGDGRGEASIMAVDGLIVIRYEDGVVSLIKATPESYQPVLHFEPAFQEGSSWAYPALSDGKLYLREQDRIMCYGLK
jgi:outer membrane protein assembly factor BamB